MLDAVFLAVGAAAGAVITWAVGRKRAREQLDAERRAALERDQARSKAKFLGRRLEVRTQQLERTTTERDEYARIASSHELRPHHFEKGQWVRKVWKDRRYGGHPSDNLEALRGDFAQFRDEHVLLSLDIGLLGGWKRLLLGDDVDDSPGQATTPLSAGQTLLFEGPADRVLEQVITFLQDDDTGLMDPGGQDQAKAWRDPDSPMIWLLTVDVLEGQASPPKVEFVEVLRIQEKIVERIVERPVVRTVPAEVTSRLCGHTPEEIVMLIEAVLEVRELDRDDRIEAEVQALAGHVPGEPPALPGD
ncbi:MAG: hypothetical protein KDK70_32860 [Myxococcales bacterium]|nr:hypothetical protein [Myxococcales bacterium]